MKRANTIRIFIYIKIDGGTAGDANGGKGHAKYADASAMMPAEGVGWMDDGGGREGGGAVINAEWTTWIRNERERYPEYEDLD